MIIFRLPQSPINLIDCSLQVLNFFSSRSSIIGTVVNVYSSRLAP